MYTYNNRTTPLDNLSKSAQFADKMFSTFNSNIWAPDDPVEQWLAQIKPLIEDKYNIKTDDKKENTDMFDFGNMFNGMFQPVARGYCKLGMNGQIAVKTSTGYKTFNTKTGRLVNCTNFAFDMDNCFWVVPTFKVERGDIVLINGKPRAVLENLPNGSIKAFSYEDSTIDEFVPEHHVFMGKTYCYGKIFCPFVGLSKSDEGMKGIMNMVMMSQMFGSNTGNPNVMGGFNPMMFMLMGKDNPLSNMFEGAFDFGLTPDAETDNEEE